MRRKCSDENVGIKYSLCNMYNIYYIIYFCAICIYIIMSFRWISDVSCCIWLYIRVNIFFREFSIILHTHTHTHTYTHMRAYYICCIWYVRAFSRLVRRYILFLFFLFFYAFSKTTAWARCHVPLRSAVCSPAVDNAPYSI